eukprot:m.26139 g.26139  ORF g.26139 m.26139 type:complete len:211 (-) comp11661_c0_seq1:77-709(-)
MDGSTAAKRHAGPKSLNDQRSINIMIQKHLAQTSWSKWRESYLSGPFYSSYKHRLPTRPPKFLGGHLTRVTLTFLGKDVVELEDMKAFRKLQAEGLHWTKQVHEALQRFADRLPDDWKLSAEDYQSIRHLPLHNSTRDLPGTQRILGLCEEMFTVVLAAQRKSLPCTALCEDHFAQARSDHSVLRILRAQHDYQHTISNLTTLIPELAAV